MLNLEIKFVYEALSPKEKEGVVRMWTNAHVLSAEEAVRRVEQVSVLILFGDEIVGVSTVYLDHLSEKDNAYFFFRMFIKKEYRGSNVLRTKLMQLNFNELKKRYAQQIKGLVFELENKKLAHLGEHTNYMTKRGYIYHGKSSRGLQLWYVRFDEAKGIFKMGEIG
ncbi:hypothetical protein KKG77_01385 [bacterium]|nr:hypothetical protein [bacterium]